MCVHNPIHAIQYIFTRLPPITYILIQRQCFICQNCCSWSALQEKNITADHGDVTPISRHSLVFTPTISSGWIWTRESQREIQKVKSQYEKDVSIIKSEMEARYRETLTERRRTAATLELELEKERQRVKGYKQALISQSQQLMEERKQLQQVKSFIVLHWLLCI